MDSDHCSLDELEPLSQIRELSITFLENVASSSSVIRAKLCGKKHLRYLSLHCKSRLGDDGHLVKEEEGISKKDKRQIEEVFDELCPPHGLENLNIEGYFGERLPSWMMLTAITTLQSLRILTMDDLACFTELPSGLSQLPCLELLQIVRAPTIKHVGLEFLELSNQAGGLFLRLHELSFSGFVEWEEWEWEEQVKAMPMLQEFGLDTCKLRHMPPGLAFHAKALKKLFIYDVKHLSSSENYASIVHLDVFNNTDLDRISNLPKLQKLVIVECPKLKILEGMPALQRLNLEDYDMERVPRYMQDVNPRHLLTCIAAGKSDPEWEKFSHIQQGKAYAHDEGCPRKWYVLYTSDPFRFGTNISRSAIAIARNRRRWLPFSKTCPIEDEWPTGRQMYVEKRPPLCGRFRCHAYRHLTHWLRQSCLHCCETDGLIKEEGPAYICYETPYGTQQRLKEETS